MGHDLAATGGALRVSLHTFQWAMVPATGYSTTFPGTENPLSSGGWTQGLDVGLDWNNTRCTPGLEYASVVNAQYSDSISHLSGFAADQWAQGTVYIAPGYTTAAYHEIELLLRFQITANTARGYEITWGMNGTTPYMLIVRWNGAHGSFDYFYQVMNASNALGTPATGDVVRAEIIGTNINVYKNGNPTPVITQSVTALGGVTWTDGNPGIGNCTDPGSTLANYGWSAYSAGNL